MACWEVCVEWGESAVVAGPARRGRLALVGAVCAIVLIRRKDFHRADGAGEAATEPAGRTLAQEAALGS